MEKKIIQIESTTVAELTDIISDKLLEKLEKRIADNNLKNNDEELLTREETAKLLKVSITTLCHWTKNKKLIAYGIGNRVYYKRGEIMSALIVFNK